jgi:hypothetical protein
MPSHAITFTDEAKKITKAIFDIQQECGFIGKDAVNPHFKSKYASLEDIWSALKPVFKKYGVMVSQVPGEIQNGCIELVTTLVHVESGEAVFTRGWMPMGKEGPQAAGSAITYARRYFLCPMLGIVAGEDDDAEAAEGREAQVKKLGGLKARKEDALKWISSRNSNVRLWLEDILKRQVDEKLTLNNEAEVVAVENAVNLLKKIEGT